ncbi:MAG TPA: acyloxyacyl hydrolase [Thermoanaerobaculia bacterium]|nr:acyloxyacyl hydrolase [Thermoanaerobaculia bacterium]
MRRSVVLCLFFLPVAVSASDFTPREMNVLLGAGESRMNFHGHSIFRRTITFELFGRSVLSERWLKSNAGASIAYSDIRQARSWFGYRYGDPNDNVRAVSSFFFVRHLFRRAYVEVGTGPMWSNRRVPAATARFNMNSQLGLGTTLFARSRFPLRVGYRFSHISNGGIGGGRNPGLEVHSVLIGTRVHAFGQ